MSAETPDPDPKQPEAPEARPVVDARTLEMLVCPLTKTRLTLNSERTELISVAARLAFPIRRGVPLLSLDESRIVEPDEIRIVSQGHPPD